MNFITSTKITFFIANDEKLWIHGRLVTSGAAAAAAAQDREKMKTKGGRHPQAKNEARLCDRFEHKNNPRMLYRRSAQRVSVEFCFLPRSTHTHTHTPNRISSFSKAGHSTAFLLQPQMCAIKFADKKLSSAPHQARTLQQHNIIPPPRTGITLAAFAVSFRLSAVAAWPGGYTGLVVVCMCECFIVPLAQNLPPCLQKRREKCLKLTRKSGNFPTAIEQRQRFRVHRPGAIPREHIEETRDKPKN